jgi:NCS1 family nucleobase:cation symporter-1
MSEGVFEGTRPTREGEFAAESHGMSPIPENARYGASWRNFTVWFAPNMQLSGVFVGTLAVTLGLGFWSGFFAIVIGIVLGALPVAYLTLWGPKTGMGQLPFARLPFGKTISVPALVQWLSSVAWDGLVGLFGGEAAQLFFHVPFYVGVIIVLALEGAIGFLGYEFIHQAQKWGSIVLGVLYVVLSWRILDKGNLPMHGSVHGAMAVAMFVLMSTIAFSGSFSWASYAADYSRYQKKDTPSVPIFLWTLGGLSISYIWMYTIGLAGAKVLTNQTAAGVQKLLGGGFLGVIALLAIVFGAVVSNAMNDYSGSLAIQAGGIKMKRNWTALYSTILAFFLILWLHQANTSGRFENILLFASYWIAPFCSVLVIDWYYTKSSLTHSRLMQLMDFRRLVKGWSALVALVVGFCAMIPFMDTSLVVGSVSKSLDGADISFYVGFAVGALVYWPLRKIEFGRNTAINLETPTASADLDTAGVEES